jgi:BirA family biotin operon repressor/biotin-[acetyl-CoA-carboxylase] ligase
VILGEPTRRRLAAATRFGDVRELSEVDSTNRYLLDLARQGAPAGVVVVADHQTAGRGRRGRTWEAAPGGALLVSLLLRPEARVAPVDRRWLVTAAVALAAADACRPRRVTIKWPNDLLLGDRKVAGILAQADAGAVVVGIGINVSWAPPGAACLGAGVDRERLLAALLVNLEGWYGRWDDVDLAYRRRCTTLGRPVRAELAGRTVEGRAEALAADGALLVATPAGPVAVAAADVVHLRPKNMTEP